MAEAAEQLGKMVKHPKCRFARRWVTLYESSLAVLLAVKTSATDE